ncbi:MAG TPA: sigma-54 dependent transcriptional regulator [Pyrinomonadaceae bacterium]|jgi:DNA-binding NtrC family response regulator|nr:sigma-54 dependent transcriptional regulator [Pyrinomonadaceae bacterium]
MKHILVVDDDQDSCELLREIFSAEGWHVDTALSPSQAFSVAEEEKIDLVVSDVNLEASQSGLDLLKDLRTQCPVILVTGFGTLDSAVEAAREGAWDFISKPFKVQEVVAIARRALEHDRNGGSAGRQPEQLSARYEEGGLLGRSPVMIGLYKEIARVAPTRSTILIIGESGAGKELVARSIHQHSTRSAGPFVAINCGALTETLLEAELFGHVRGAFTGAVGDRKGLWEEAGGGTLFLDEVGETSTAFQVKLLRALQEGEIRRVGASKAIQVDARILAATNRNLDQDVKAGKFREDLFYRLSVVTLRVPALKERRTDIPMLAEHFLATVIERETHAPLTLSEETVRTLVAYGWPGNVRELESAIEYAVLHARGHEIVPEDLPEKLQSAQVRAAARSPLSALFEDLPSLDELERRYLLYILEVAGGNRTRAAEILRVDRRTLYRMIERYGIDNNGK